MSNWGKSSVTVPIADMSRWRAVKLMSALQTKPILRFPRRIISEASSLPASRPFSVSLVATQVA